MKHGTILPIRALPVRQTVVESFCDTFGRPDFLWSGIQDFATLRDTSDAISDSYSTSQWPYLAFDGNDATGWQTNTAYGSSSGVAWLGMKNLKRNIKAIKYLNNDTGQAVTSVKVQYSIDLITWIDIQTTTVINTTTTWNEFVVATYAGGDAGHAKLNIQSISAKSIG